jgi:hypothetical protein
MFFNSTVNISRRVIQQDVESTRPQSPLMRETTFDSLMLEDLSSTRKYKTRLQKFKIPCLPKNRTQ